EPATVVIKEWEEAGASLARSLGKYLDFCLSLGQRSLQKGAHRQKLAIHIDLALESLHVVLDQQLVQSRLTLAQTRNTIMSPIYSLPEEVLSEIFMHVIYSPMHGLSHTSMRDSLLEMFPGIYRLQSVCHTWRCVVLGRGAFWSIALIFCSGMPPLRCVEAINISAQRCQGDLHLAAVLDIHTARAFRAVEENTLRFRTVNVTTSSHHQLRGPLIKFLQSGPFPRLNELSIHTEQDLLDLNRALGDSEYVITPHDHIWISFLILIKSLSVLRISGANFTWGEMAFSDQLVELCIQRVVIGFDTELAKLVSHLSVAPQLRDLKIISTHSFMNTNTFSERIKNHRTFFPNLESLLLEDLSYNALFTLSQIIAPGSHRLALLLTAKSTQGLFPGDIDIDLFDIQDLCDTLQNFAVDTLLFARKEVPWLSPGEIFQLVNSTPTLKTLKIDSWLFGKAEWEALVRYNRFSRTVLPGRQYPTLDCLYLSRVLIQDQDSLKRVVQSHSIQRMVLGASLCNEGGTFLNPEPLCGDEEIVNWLRSNVPDFSLIGEDTHPLDFASSVWQL
ncbi:hypothetical protein FRC11_007900, partial [Ceratobasidium sp. 423]